MKRFFVTEKNVSGSYFVFNEAKTIRYIRNVLRLHVGDQIELFDGKGNIHLAELKKVMKLEVNGKIVSSKIEKANQDVKFILAQALPRAGKLDEIIRMNTEVGVEQFIIFESDFSIAKADRYSPDKMERLERVAIEASKQSERSNVPEIIGPTHFSEVLEKSADWKILLHSRADETVDLKTLLPKIERDSQTVLVLIGPEGGFSPEELRQAQKSWIYNCSLNLPILRTETAGVVVSGLLLA